MSGLATELVEYVVPSSPTTRIAYAARTAACTFLLDDGGVCRSVVPTIASWVPAAARRCIGAQFVAAVSARAARVIEVPRAGAAMVFATVQADGALALVRTGAVEEFAMMDRART